MGKYQIISTEYSIEDLEKMVNEAIKDGWRPIGGIALRTQKEDLFSYKTTFYQAIYKED